MISSGAFMPFAILQESEGGPFLLTVILDGENAWEW